MVLAEFNNRQQGKKYVLYFNESKGVPRPYSIWEYTGEMNTDEQNLFYMASFDEALDEFQMLVRSSMVYIEEVTAV